MAQVIKFDKGGNTTSQKYITVNNVKLYDNEENRKQWETAAANGDGAAQDILATLNDENYDNSASVSIQGDRVEFNNMRLTGLSDRGDTQLRKGSNFWRDTFGDKTKNNAVSRWKNFRYTPPEEKKEEVKLGTIRHGDNSSFIYHDQEDGTKVYSAGPINKKNEAVIKDIFTNLKLNRADLEKSYNFDNWGDSFWTLHDWYQANQDYDTNALIKRIQDGKASDDDIELLTLMGFNVGKPTKPEVKLTGLELDDKFFEGRTNAEALKKAFKMRGLGIKRSDDDTHWLLTGNREFIDDTWYSGDLDFLRDTEFDQGAIHNGRLFSKQQVLDEDVDIASHIAPFIAAWRNASDYRSGYDAASRTGVRFVNDRTWSGGDDQFYGGFNTQFDPSKQFHKIYSDYFGEKVKSDLPWNITDVTGGYDGLGNKKIMAYIDHAEKDRRNDIGMYGADWVVYDPDDAANPYRTFENEEDMVKALGLSRLSSMYGHGSGEFNTSTWFTADDGQEYAEYAPITTKGNANNTIWIGRDGNYYYARKDSDGKFKPKRIYNLELLKQVLKNPENYDNKIFDDLSDKNKDYDTEEYLSRYRRLKNGGIIKAQYGAAVHASNTKSSTKNTEDAQTDITDSHLINGEDGGLTKAEKMQLWAAVGDLAGVGMSFTGPVGNIAGAVTGLGATATRFAADVKHDGFQWSDAGTAAVGAVLDLASALPLLGTGAKTMKAVKIIKSAATPIMKTLSLLGAANGVAAMSRVMSGEKVTVNDVQAILGGLSSGLIAGKQIKDTIGDAKLASKLSGLKTDKANAALVKNPTAVFDGKKATLDDTIMSQIKGKSVTEAQKAIKDFLKTSYDIDVPEAEVKNLAKQFGLTENKGEYKGFRWKNLLKWKNPVVRKNNTIDFEAPEDASATSAWRYFLNPFARNKALGAGWHGFGEQTGMLNEVTAGMVRGAHRRVNAKRGTLADYALLRRTVDNPGGFNNSVLISGAPVRLPGWGYPAFGRRATERPPLAVWEKEWQPTMVYTQGEQIPTSLGSLGDVSAVRNPIELNGLPRADVLARRGKISGWKGKQLMEPTATHPFGTYYDNVVIMEKKGGVLKGKYGLKTENYNFLKNTPTFWHPSMGAPKTEFKPITFDPNNVTGKIDLSTTEGRTKDYLVKNPVVSFNQNIIDVDGNKQKLRAIGIEPKDASIKPKNTSVDTTSADPDIVTGGGRTNKLFENLNISSIDAIEGFKAMDALNRAKQNRDIAYKSADAYKPMSELQPRSYRPLLFNKFATDQIADARLQSKLQSGLYADPKVATQQWLATESNIFDGMSKYNMNQSDNLTAQANSDAERRMKIDQFNIGTVQPYNTKMAATQAGIKANADLAYNSERSKIMNGLGLYAQNKINNNNIADFVVSEQKSQAQAMLNGATTPKEKKYAQSLLDSFDDDYAARMRKRYEYRNALSAKKGGKLRPTSDQMLLDNNKLVAKAIEKLNDNTAKIILKALS